MGVLHWSAPGTLAGIDPPASSPAGNSADREVFPAPRHGHVGVEGIVLP